ncbi:MAG: hypothetical protein RIR34_187 [Actinomycetota bacterium]
MVYKLNAFHQPVWRTPSALQIGLDARRIILEDVSGPTEKFIDALYFGIAQNQVEAIAKQAKLPPEDAIALLRKLQPLLESDPPRNNGKPNPGEPLNVEASFPDRAHASLQQSTNGLAVLHERGRRAIFIEKLDSTGVVLMNAFASAGVGTIVTQDSAKVSGADVGPLAYPTSLVGHQRIAAATMLLQATWPSTKLVNATRTRESKLNNIDLAILTASAISDTHSMSLWNSRQVAQLEIRFEPTGARISRVVTPGQDPCLICRELCEHMGDTELAAVDAQLAQSDMSFAHTANRIIGTGLALENGLFWLDRIGGFGNQATTSYRLTNAGVTSGAATTQVRLEDWGFHSDCSCKVVANQLAGSRAS